MGSELEEQKTHRRWLARPAGMGTLGLGFVAVVGVIVTVIVERHAINFGDLPTWGATIFAAVAGGTALTQLYQQRKAFSEELTRQRKRDALLDAQLRQVERVQANQVDLDFTTTQSLLEGSDAIVHMMIVENESSRPIRHVAGWIDTVPNASPVPADSVVEVIDVGRISTSGHGFGQSRHDHREELMRRGERCGFLFETAVERHPDARMSVEFEDGAGQKWRIDRDLSLSPIDRFSRM